MIVLIISFNYALDIMKWETKFLTVMNFDIFLQFRYTKMGNYVAHPDEFLMLFFVSSITLKWETNLLIHNDLLAFVFG